MPVVLSKSEFQTATPFDTQEQIQEHIRRSSASTSTTPVGSLPKEESNQGMKYEILNAACRCEVESRISVEVNVTFRPSGMLSNTLASEVGSERATSSVFRLAKTLETGGEI